MPDPELLPPPPPKKNVTTSELLPPPPKKKDYGGGDLGNGGSVFSDPFAFLIKEQPELHPKPQKVSGKTAPQEPTPFVKAVSFDKFLNKTIRINDNEEISIDPRTIPISPVISDNGDMFVYKVSKKVSEGKPLNDIEKKFINANKSPILSLSAYDIQSLDDFVTKNDISSAVLPESATALVPSMAGKTVGEASGSPEGRYAQVRALKEKLSENLLFLQKNLVFSPSDDEMKSMKTIMDELSELDNIETKLARQFTIVSDKGATALVSTDESGNSWNRFLGFIKNYGTLPSMLISDKNENVINKVNELPSEFMTGLNYVRFKEPVEFERVSRLLAEGKPISESQVAVLTNYGIDIERQKLKDQYADGKIDEAQYNVQNKELGNKAYENLLGNKEAGRAFFSSNIAEVLDLMNIEQPNITGTYTDYIFGHRWNYTAEEIEDAAKVVARVNNIDTSDARYKDIVKWLQDNEGAMIGKNSIYKAGWTRDLARGIIQPLSGVSKFIEAPFKTDEQQYAEGKSQGNVNITDIPVKRIADGWQGTVGKVLEGTGQLVSQIGLSYALAGGSMALGTAILGRAGTAALAGDIALADMSAGQIVGKTLLGSKDAIATYAMSYASTYDGYKKTAMNYTSDDATATAVAGGMAGLEGITENFLSPLDIARGVGKKIFGNPSFAKEAINIIDGVAVVNKEAAIKNIILKAVKESGNVILSEIGEEEVTQLADFGVNAMLNPNSQSFKDRNLWQEIGETAYQTGLSMVIPALASGVSAYNANNFAKGSLLIAAQNTQRFVDNLKLRLADNEIDQEQYNNFTQLINTAKVVNETLPQKVDGQKLNSNEKADYIFSRVSEAVLEKQKEKSKDAAEVNVLNQKIKEQQDFRTKILKNEGTKNAENNGNNQNAEGSQTDNTDNSQNTKVATSAENIKFEDKVRQVYPTLKNATDEEVNSFVTENAMDNPVQVLDKLGEDSFNEVIAKVPTEELQAKLDFLLSTDTENPNVEVLDGIIASREKEYTTPAVPLSEGNSALRDVENKINDVADEYLFHGTGEGAFRRIREEGMKSKSGGYLYFADTEQYATTYAQRKGNSFGDRVLRVKKSDAYEGDINTGLKGDFKIKGDIKPEDIEINDKGKWVPIQEYSDERIGILPLSKPNTNETENNNVKGNSALRDVESTAKGLQKVNEVNPTEFDKIAQSQGFFYHGSDKVIKGEPKSNRIETSIKTHMGGIPFKDLWDAFYVTNNKEWAKFFSPKKGKVHNVKLSAGAKVLDVSEVTESTHLKNAPILGRNLPGTDFKFQKDFDEYSFNWLNRKRESNGKTPLTREQFEEKDLENSFKPSHKNWFLDGLGAEAFADYAKDRGYDAVKFQREIAIINPKIADFVDEKIIPSQISEAYHKAKADGSNPELVKAVEEALSKPTNETTGTGDKKYLPKSGNSPQVKTYNIDTAKSLLTNLGVDASFSGYSDTNGVSVYFIDSSGKKIRVSNHGVTNKERMANEVLLYFDTKTLGLGGKEGFKSYAEQNKKAVEAALSKPNTNEPAPTKEVITPETKKEEGNSELRDVKRTATPKAEERTFTKNDLDRADAKKIYQQVREVDVTTDAEQIALEYIAIGGKVSESSINEVAGSVKRATLNTGRRDLKSSEAKTRDYSDKNAKSFDGIAHELWGIFEQRVSETDIKNALMDAVRDNTTRLDAAKSYLERYSPEYIEAKQQEKFYQEHLEEIEAEEKAINEWLNSENEIATEAIADINYVNSLISKYETENKGQDKQPATATESKTDKGVSNDASTQKTEKQKRIDDFNKKADKIANDLIDFLTPKSTRGAKTSGMGIADIINGATTAIKAAYAVSQNIKEAVDAGIKYFKDNWNTDELGELPEDALREKLTNDFEVPVEQIAKSVAKEIRDGNISYNDAKEGKSKEFIDELNKELFGSKKFNFDEDAFKEQIRKQKAIGITEEEVVELLSSSKKITKAQRAIISEVFGESAETDKLAADLKEAFNNLAKGEKPKMVLNRLSKSNITKLVDALRETLTYTPVSNKQLSKMADNIVESMDLNQAEDYLNAMINNSVLGLRQVLRAKLIVALGNEGKNELATNLVRDMADEAIQTGRHSQSLVLAYEILGAKANPAIRAEFERERVEVLQQKAAQMTHNYAKAISEQEVEIGKLNEKIHNMTQKSSAMNKIKEVINRLCGLRNKK